MKRRVLYYDKVDQYRKADTIIQVVCQEAGVSWLSLLQHRPMKNYTTVIGIIAVICNDYSIHPSRIGALLRRSRPVMIITAQRYWDYLRVQSGKTNRTAYDKYIQELYDNSHAKLKKMLKKN